MKHAKLFVGIMLISTLLAACNTGMTDSRPSKTTHIDKIELMAKFYTLEQQENLLNWNGGWEFNSSESRLKLSNLMPAGEIKDNTYYEVTVSGKSSGPMDKFQFEFTVPGSHDDERWIDLSSVPAPMKIPAGDFIKTVTLKTEGKLKPPPKDPSFDKHAKDYYNSGMLAFTNAVGTSAADRNSVMVTLTNVTITITEK